MKIVSMSALLAGALLLPSVASADLILGINAPTLTGNSANSKTGTASQNMLENLSSVAVNDSGGSILNGVGNSVDGIIRYAATTVADRDNNASGVSRTATSAWQVTFTVEAPLGTTYDLKIDTSRIGALTSNNDSSNALGVAKAELRAMTGSYTGPGTTSGTLNLPQQIWGGVGGFENAGKNDAINQSTTLNVTGIAGTGAPQLFSLSFNWQAYAESTGLAPLPIVGGGYSGDDAAVRLGMATTWAQVVGGAYPGAGSRDINADGHFVNVKATMTVVPEPSTWVMAVMAGLGLVALRRRKAA